MPPATKYTDDQLTAAGRASYAKLPPALQRMVDPSKVRFIQAASDNQDAYAQVQDANTIKVPDPGAFMQNTDQLVGHELTHIAQMRAHPTIQSQFPQSSTDKNQMYNYGGPDGLSQARQQGKTMASYSREAQASIVQHYVVDNAYYQKLQQSGQMTPAMQENWKKMKAAYEPFINDFNKWHLANFEPTAKDAKTINTTPTNPQVPLGVHGMEKIEGKPDPFDKLNAKLKTLKGKTNGKGTAGN